MTELQEYEKLKEVNGMVKKSDVIAIARKYAEARYNIERKLREESIRQTKENMAMWKDEKKKKKLKKDDFPVFIESG